MEYKTDKRTKNLTLRDIHGGDWVQVWSETTERYSPPLKIISIHDDGTIHLVTSDKERPTPWEEDIKNVDALPITPELLKVFGFEKSGDSYSYNSSVFAFDEQLDVMDFFYIDKYYDTIKLGYIAYMHDLQQVLSEERNFIGDFKLEWKGIER